MKKIVVISDNHGQQSMLDKIRKLESDSDYYVHCDCLYRITYPKEMCKYFYIISLNSTLISP